ncbi:zinc finger protein 347, partial [Homo sapiens]
MLEQGKEPFTLESQVQIAGNPDGWEWIKAVITALSSEFVMKDLLHKGKSNTGEVFQTVMLERQESQDIEGCSFREVQKNTHGLEYQCRDAEGNYKGVLLTQEGNLTHGRDEHDKRDARNKLIKNQ